MTEDNATAGEKADDANGSDKPETARGSDKPDHAIPKARFDEEAGKRKALEREIDAFADGLIGELPDALKELSPEGLAPLAKLKWWAKAQKSAAIKAEVPETDKGKAKVTPKDRDVSNLPPVARIASAYKRTG